MSDDQEKQETQGQGIPGKKQLSPPDDERKRDGKKGILWTIEITYFAGDHKQELKKRDVRNLYWSEVLKFREDVFIIGFLIMEAPGRYRLVAPANVHEVFFHRQNGYFSVY